MTKMMMTTTMVMMMTTTTMTMTEVFEHLPEVELRPGLLPRSFRACALQTPCTIGLLHPVDHDYIDHGVFFIKPAREAVTF